MTRQLRRIALYALAAAAAAGWIAAGLSARRADRIVAADAVRILQGRGFQEAAVLRSVDAPDLPPAVEAVARFSGSVDFGPPQDAAAGDTCPVGQDSAQETIPQSASPDTPEQGSPFLVDPTALWRPWRPQPSDLRGGVTDAQIVAIGGSRAMVKADWWAEVRLQDGTTVRRDATLEIADAEVAARAVRLPLRNALRVGVTLEGGPAVEYTRMIWRRCGVYGRLDGETAAAGIEWRW